MRFSRSYNLVAFAIVLAGAALFNPTNSFAEESPDSAMNSDSKKIVMIDSSASTVKWEGRKITGKHDGIVSISTGKVELDGDKITGGRFEIDMSSIRVDDIKDPKDNAKLTNHLKSDDFFNVTHFPKAVFEITRAEQSSTDLRSYNLTGNLTILGVSHPVSFPARIEISGSTARATAKVDVDRTLWNIRYGSGKFFESLGDKLIYDHFTVEVALSGDVKPEA